MRQTLHGGGLIFIVNKEKQESCINFNLILTLSFRQEAPLG